VLFVDHTATLGGGEIALLNLVRHLDPQRYMPCVALFSDGPLAGALRAAGIETHIVPLSASVVHARKDGLRRSSLLRINDIVAALSFIFRLSAFIRSQDPDVVHTNSLKSDILGGFAARLTGVPVIWHVRDRIADDYLPPKVVRLFRFLARRVPSVLIANSRATLATLLPEQPAKGCPSWAHVVHDGTPVGEQGPVGSALRTISPPADTTVRSADPTTPPLIGIVGRISPWKGQDVFLRAAAIVLRHYPDTRFQVIGAALFGETDYEQKIRELAVSLGIADRVEFTGFRSDVSELMSRLDLLVHASIIPEPFGQVLIEAMAAGKPVVATAGGGTPEIVLDGQTGLLVPMNDPGAMADAIVKILSAPANARIMGHRGWERVRDQFSIAKVAANVQSAYDELLTTAQPSTTDGYAVALSPAEGPTPNTTPRGNNELRR
jgi:glycosyltransferase involved in cell wall biosynthesis